jgi:Tfp pilus assembly protein PilZ
METNDMWMTSVIVGGTVFIAFILIWFIGVYLKKRVRFGAESDPVLALEPHNPWAEKRQAARLAVSWHATLTTPQATAPVQLKDVSHGGAFAACKNPLPLNQRFGLTIELPDGQPLGLNAVVVWSNSGVSADKVVNRGMGIRFIDNDEVARQRLRQALEAVVAASKTEPK